MAGKIPAPALDDAGTDFDDYKIRIDRWCQVSKVSKKASGSGNTRGDVKKTFWNNKENSNGGTQI